jgi:hypothetical protein
MVSIKESTEDGTIVPGKHAQTKTQHHRLLVPLWKPYRNSIFKMSTPLNKR